MSDEPIDVLADLTDRVGSLSDTVHAHGEHVSEIGRKIDGQVAEHGRVAALLQRLVDETVTLHEAVRKMAEKQDDDSDRIGALERRSRVVDNALGMVHSEPPRGSNGNGHGHG